MNKQRTRKSGVKYSSNVNEQKDAMLLYKDGLSIEQIAEKIGVSVATVYRWKSEVAEKKNTNWDTIRELGNLSPRELVNIYAETIKNWIIEIRIDESKLSDPSVADAMCKHIANLNRLDPTNAYWGAILDVIKETNVYLQRHDPDLALRMIAHWDGIKEHLKKLTEYKGL